MSEEEQIPDTIEKGIKSWLAAGAFTLVLVGGDVMKESHGEGLGFWVGGVLVLLALPVYLSAAWWRLVKSKMDRRALEYVTAFSQRIPWWARSLIFVALAFALAQTMPRFGGSTTSVTTFAQWPEPYSPRIVSGKTFRNERVPLDGIQYDHCIFENVTLVYNGTTAIRLENNRFMTLPGIDSDNPSVIGAFALLFGLGATNKVRPVNIPSSTHIEPMELPK